MCFPLAKQVSKSFIAGEGAIGASRTFLAMGVPLVIASQWKVDSYATAELMIRFHYYRKIKKLLTVEALRHSQLDLLQNGEFQHPSFWAAFTAYGGYSKF